VAFARRRLRTQLEQRGAPPAERERSDEVLDPKALTIGFARRFATYKRATLLFRDPERLARILSNPERPVQIIYAGKAHPADQEGKDFIRQVVHYARRPEFRQRIVCPVFSAYRMVKEYTERLYLPAERWWATLGAKGLERARALATWKGRVRSGWREVAVLSVKADGVAPLEAGATRPVQAEVALGSLRPEDVSVVLYSGPLTGEGEILSASVSDMKVEGTPRAGAYLYSGTLQGKTTGLHGFRVRILPAHEDLFSPLAMNCIVWG
jgi:glucan phosphorylase